MYTYLSLLRGINVSGQKSIKMLDLKALYETLQFTNVTTYIQSGNVVFKSTETNTQKIAELISNAIKTQYHFDVPVTVITATNLYDIAHNNTYVINNNHSIETLHVTLLNTSPTIDKLTLLSAGNYGADAYIINNTTVYLHCPSGYGTTKLSNNYLEAKLKTSATTRNWKTILKLLEIVNATP